MDSTKRIDRIKTLIAQAKAKGLDTTDWERRLAEFEKKYRPCPRVMPPIPIPSAELPAEAQAVAQHVAEHGICLLWSETVKDYLAFIRDDFDLCKVPPGFVIYTDSELRELFDNVQHLCPATLRLIHEAKKLGGKVSPQRCWFAPTDNDGQKVSPAEGEP